MTPRYLIFSTVVAWGLVFLCSQAGGIWAVSFSRHHEAKELQGSGEKAHIFAVRGGQDLTSGRRAKKEGELPFETATSFSESPEMSPFNKPNRPQRLWSSLRSFTSGAISRGRNRFRKWFNKKKSGLRRFWRYNVPGHLDRLRTLVSPSFTSPVFYDDNEPGKGIIAQLVAAIANVESPVVSGFSTEGDPEKEQEIQACVRRSLLETPLVEGSVVHLVSTASNAERNFTIKGAVMHGSSSIAFPVTDVDLNTNRVLKGFVLRASEKEQELEDRILRLVGLLQDARGPKDAVTALARLRLMVHEDAVYFPQSDAYFVPGIIPNMFMVYPQAATSLDKVLQVLPTDESRRTNRQIYFLLLSATTQIIRLVACYHTLGLVHGHLHLGSFFVWDDGRLILGPSKDVYKHGVTYNTVRYRSAVASPEFKSTDFLYTYSYDSWQVGTILYHLWCNKNPYGLENNVLPEFAGRGKLLLSWDECSPSVPLAVQNLIKSFLHKSRWRRVLPRKAYSNKDYREVVRLTLDLVAEFERETSDQ